MDNNRTYIALGSRLKGTPQVITLGVKPNFFDYTPNERSLILDSDLILYPTLNYAQFLTTIGVSIFPSLETYIYSDEKIKQTTLFNMLGIPHPRTRIYFRLHHGDILKDFDFPFIAKLPRRSSQGRGIFMINNPVELASYLSLTNVAYIQEYIPHNRDLRIILINYTPILAYWRERTEKTFKTNLYQGGKINFKDIPKEGLSCAQEYARKCRLNDVGLDMIYFNGKWCLIEANMNYGRKGLNLKGMDLKDIIKKKLLSGELTHESSGNVNP
jgi:ribosomal protein S6--L-glutamate ligase